MADIPDNVKNALEIIPVTNVDEVLKHALTKQPKKIKWTATDEAALAGIILNEGVDLGGKSAH